ncbi:MAG: S41 family peptidase [bacterium]
MRSSLRNWILTFILFFITCTIQAQPVSDSVYYQRSFYLCKVWGHAKYYHSEICYGTIKWDDALLKAISDAKNCGTNEEFNDSLISMLTFAGKPVKNPIPLPEVPDSLNNILDYDWTQSDFFSNNVKDMLDTINQNISFRSNYYIYATPGVGNPIYIRDTSYFNTPVFPSEELRFLALFRYWNAINYFYPYKNIMDNDWDSTLKYLIPYFAKAENSIDYTLCLRKLLARINDSHSFLYSTVNSQWEGSYDMVPPFTIRYIENETVVTKVLPGIDDISPGDIVKEIDGHDIYTLRDSLREFSYGSNDIIIERNLNDIIMNGEEGEYPLAVFNGTGLKSTTFTRTTDNFEALNTDESPSWKDTVVNDGCTFGIVDMAKLQSEEVPQMFEDLWDMDAIIFDIRNYPNGTLWDIVNYIFKYPINIANFTIPILYYPGRFNWTEAYIGNGTSMPYSGTIIMLFDERTQSQAEYTCMGLEQFENSIKIGSTTAAADGNVSYVYLPGRAVAYYTGIGTYYPDYTPTQRIGIIPDIEVNPTIAGIKAGRDEVLERALDCSLISGIDERNISENIKIFPNPFVNSFKYSLTEDRKQYHINLEIIDLLGRSRMKFDDCMLQGEIVLAGIETGTYILKATTGNTTTCKILIKY